MSRHRLSLLGFCLLVTLIAVVSLAPATALATVTNQAAALDSSILEQVNAVRLKHGLTALTLSPALTQAATDHSREMIVDGYFAHSSSDGAPFWQRIAHFYPSAGHAFWSVGENLFWTSGVGSATTSLQAWMASPPHRSNILSPGWRQIGIGAVTSPEAPGTYGKRQVTVITTDFGVRR